MIKGCPRTLTDGFLHQKQEIWKKEDKEKDKLRNYAGLRHCTTPSRVFAMQFEHAVLDSLMGFLIGRAMRRLQLPRQSIILNE